MPPPCPAPEACSPCCLSSLAPAARAHLHCLTTLPLPTPPLQAPVGAFYTVDTVLIPDLAALMDASPPPSATTTTRTGSPPSVASAYSPSTTTAAGPSGLNTTNGTRPNAASSAAAPAALMAALAGLLALAL